MHNESDELVAAFEAGRVDAANFPHRRHIQSATNCSSTSRVACAGWRQEPVSRRFITRQ